MPDLLLHPATGAAVEAFLRQPSHAMCLVGPDGAGKSYLARQLAMRLLKGAKPEALHIISPDPNIGIEHIRGLHSFLKLKVPGTGDIKRVVLIENAERMGDEAQNSLLKTLEEPPADTVFIMTTNGAAGLKPTIYSRVQKIPVQPISLELAKQAFPIEGLIKAYHLSGGYAGLMYNLINDARHELVEAVESAKYLMAATPFERLMHTDKYSKDKDSLSLLLYAMERVISAALIGARSPAQLKRLASASRAVYEAKVDLQKSANSKLLLSDLFLQL